MRAVISARICNLQPSPRCGQILKDNEGNESRDETFDKSGDETLHRCPQLISVRRGGGEVLSLQLLFTFFRKLFSGTVLAGVSTILYT